MNFGIKPKTDAATTNDKILVAQDKIHIRMLHGLASNGGRKSIGNFIIELVNDGSDYATIQLFQCALGIKPKVQSWNRTKTKVVKTEVIKYKKPDKKKKIKPEFKYLGVEEI